MKEQDKSWIDNVEWKNDPLQVYHFTTHLHPEAWVYNVQSSQVIYVPIIQSHIQLFVELRVVHILLHCIGVEIDDHIWFVHRCIHLRDEEGDCLQEGTSCDLHVICM